METSLFFSSNSSIVYHQQRPETLLLDLLVRTADFHGTEMNPDPINSSPVGRVRSDTSAAMRRLARSNPNISFAEIMHLLCLPERGHPYILDLTSDILERVIFFVNTSDLTALRSTCKKLRKAAMSKFVDHFIKCRRHVLSAHSLNTLVEIATHPYFGKFVEAIILDTTCSLGYIKPGSTTDESWNYDGFYHVLEEVFGYLSVNGNLDTLGVTDRNPTSFGIHELLSPSTTHRFRQERGHILLNLQQCAKDAKLNVSQLDLDSAQYLGPDFTGLDVDAFASTALDLSGGLSASTSLKFKVAMTNMSEFRLIWDHKRKSLEIAGLTEWHLGVSDNMVFSLFQDMTSVSAANITELTLSGCHARMDYDYKRLMELLCICSRTLKRVKLSGIIIESDSKWSPVLRLLARAPSLMEFEMEALSRQIHTFVNFEWQSAMIVHIDQASGHGDKVSAELNNLAATMEADEFAWESIDDREPEKLTYCMTRRRKTSRMVEDSLQAIKTPSKRLLTWVKKRKNNKHAHVG